MKSKDKESKPKKSPVIIGDGKWTTQDGMSFNTATKAWEHTKEISHVASLGSEADPESEPESDPESEPETSPEPEDPDTEPDSDPE